MVFWKLFQLSYRVKNWDFRIVLTHIYFFHLFIFKKNMDPRVDLHGKHRLLLIQCKLYHSTKKYRGP